MLVARSPPSRGVAPTRDKECLRMIPRPIFLWIQSDPTGISSNSRMRYVAWLSRQQIYLQYKDLETDCAWPNKCLMTLPIGTEEFTTQNRLAWVCFHRWVRRRPERHVRDWVGDATHKEHEHEKPISYIGNLGRDLYCNNDVGNALDCRGTPHPSLTQVPATNRHRRFLILNNLSRKSARYR